jgi:hypothetical protein
LLKEKTKTKTLFKKKRAYVIECEEAKTVNNKVAER